MAMLLHKHCTIIAGSMEAFKKRQDEMGIEVTRGDGMHFKKGEILFPHLFCYKEFEVHQKKYLRFGLSHLLTFAQPIPVERMQSFVMKLEK